MLLALETSCDETAAAVVDMEGNVLASEVSTQVEAHRPFGGVVPEIASRAHLLRIRPLIESALERAGIRVGDCGAFAATSGPGLASSLLIGNTTAKALALAEGKPFLAVNHLEGHLLSPFMGEPGGVRPGMALIVSGGHTLLVRVSGIGQYEVVGRTRDDAAGEAFDKGAKMLGLPYPGGPRIDQLAREGRRDAYDFPRSMIDSGDFAFSFSGLKTSLLYMLPRVGADISRHLPDLCASYQEAIVEVLLTKTIRAARRWKLESVSVSGGVSCNTRLRELFTDRCQRAGLELLLAKPQWTTDNAAMIAYAAVQKFKAGAVSSFEEDVNPNLSI